ncbi:MAG TPA: putative toxin-antitoxin system toxin component, PIN family [Acidimicrobiales bacterium]|nr:putative toxin-antitoxin system toxin component, PIN family [Acidimicrobiales bacterium]
MRVVVDANVFVSAAIRNGPAHRVVMAWLEREAFELVICPALLDEVREVLTQRPRLRRWIDVDTAEAYLATIEFAADVVADPVDLEARTRDVDDDYLVALALEHSADFIVSGDKDLIEWTEQRPPVITPAQFEDLLS